MSMNDVDNTTLLTIKNMWKKYEDGGPEDRDILQDFNITLKKKDFLCILGPSGCGKSTLIRCIGGFEKYQRGEILINGKRVSAPSPERIMVFQDFNQLFPWKTVEENIQYPLRLKGIKDKAKLQELSDKYLEKVDLKGKGVYYPHQLSGGMKARVAIAKAFALKPDIILMDEPFASLDAMTRKNLQKELLHIAEKEEITIIFITHNIQEALCLGKRVILMSKQGGEIKVDVENTLPRPAGPSTPGFAELWEKLSSALETENMR